MKREAGRGQARFFVSRMGGVASSLRKGVASLLGRKPRRPVDLREVIDTKRQQAEPVTQKENPPPPVTVEQLVATARKRLGLDVTNDYNFAIVGQSGSGKSSMVNALRGVEDGEEAAAPIGETETTVEVKKYTHPKLPHVALWDIPGAGTLMQPPDTYFEKHMLYAFDCILILSADRFFEIDFGIARKAREYKRPCSFVRTKADLSVRSIARRKRMKMAEASTELRSMVMNSFHSSLKMCGLSTETFAQKLYLVSAWAFMDENVYNNGSDKSLAKMDEEELLNFVTNSIRYRA